MGASDQTPPPVAGTSPAAPAASSPSIHPKVAAGVLAGAAVTIAVWALSYFAHITEPPAVVGAEVELVSFVIAYLVPGTQESGG